MCDNSAKLSWLSVFLIESFSGVVECTNGLLDTYVEVSCFQKCVQFKDILNCTTAVSLTYQMCVEVESIMYPLRKK